MIGLAHGIKNVTKNNPCPICGKPDWCGFMPASNGGYLLICQRDTEKANAIGRDGNFYVVVGVSQSGATIFEEANQRRQKELARKGRSHDYEFKQTPEPKTLAVFDQVEVLPNKKLHQIYKTMMSFLTLEPSHQEYLKKEGWTDELIKKYGIVSFPEKDYLRFKYRKDTNSKNPYRKKLARMVMDELGLDSLRGVPGAYRDKNGCWTFAGRSGIIFPLLDIHKNIYRLRIRMDFRDVNAEIHSNSNGDDYFIDNGEIKFISMAGIYQIFSSTGEKIFDKSQGKYRNFASYFPDEKAEKEGFIKNVYSEGCEAGNQIGFYYDASRDDMHIAYITEGEKKAIFSNEHLRAPFISFPGVNSWNLLFQGNKGERPIDVLKRNGVKIIIIAFDADKKVNERVLSAEKQVINSLRYEGFVVGVAEWDIKIAKGIDDLLAKGYKPTYAVI